MLLTQLLTLNWRTRLAQKFSRVAAHGFSMSGCSGATVAALALALALGGSACRAQEWSPDGKQIAVGGAALTLLDVTAAATPPVVVSGVVNAGFPIWSPDGKTVALLTDGKKLVLLDVESRKLTTVNPNVAGAVGWAPDSKTFAFIGRDDQGGLQLHPAYRDGGSQLPPIPLPCKTLAATCRPVAWVPHTDNMIVAGGDGGKIDLYLIDQGQVVKLTKTGDVLSFIVSADGNRVLWARRSPNTHYILLSLHEITIDSRTERKLSFPNVVPEVNPHPRRAVDAVTSLVFAPDMTHFAFVTQGGPQVGPGETQLWLSDIGGKSALLLGKGRARKDLLPADPAVAIDATGVTLPASLPVFSLDSAQIALLDLGEGKRTLELITLAMPQTPRLLPLPDLP